MSTIPLRRVAIAAVATLSVLGTPAHSHGAYPVVAARADGSLVRLSLDTSANKITSQQVLVRGGPRLIYRPTHMRGGVVSVVASSPAGAGGRLRTDAVLVDYRNGRIVGSRKDGRTGQLLLAADGQRYVLTADATGRLVGIVRTDARGGQPKTLVAPSGDKTLSGAGLAPNGRTLYVARKEGRDRASVLYAVDTSTGSLRALTYLSPYQDVVHVVVSPTGRTLAVTFVDQLTSNGSAYRVGLVETNLAVSPVRPIDATGNLLATGFTSDGEQLLLTSWDTQTGASGLVLADAVTLQAEAVPDSSGLRHAIHVY